MPAYNAAATVSGCLQALTKQETRYPYEIILVDDGSTDHTAQEAEQFAPQVCVIKQTHAGVAAARNHGVASATGSLILFTDADCEPTPTWIETLANGLEHADGAKGTYRTHQKSLTARWVQAEYESKYRRMATLPTIDFIDTYSAAYRRDVFDRAGGFNEKLEVDEDQELSFRLAESGVRLVFVPEAIVYHSHAATPQAYVKRKFKIGYWKVLVAAMHPSRIISDSHTPQSVKVQMALLGLLLLVLPAALFSRPARKASLFLTASLLATTLPITAQIAGESRAVALAAPFMSVLRAAGLLTGIVAGLLRFGPRIVKRLFSTSTAASRIKYNIEHD